MGENHDFYNQPIREENESFNSNDSEKIKEKFERMSDEGQDLLLI